MGEFRGGDSPANTASFHPEGQLAAAGYWNGEIKVFDTFNKKMVAKLLTEMGGKSIRNISWSPTGRHIASASADGSVRLWSTFTYEAIGQFIGHSSPINQCCFSPTGDELVTVSDDSKVIPSLSLSTFPLSPSSLTFLPSFFLSTVTYILPLSFLFLCLFLCSFSFYVAFYLLILSHFFYVFIIFFRLNYGVDISEN